LCHFALQQFNNISELVAIVRIVCSENVHQVDRSMNHSRTTMSSEMVASWYNSHRKYSTFRISSTQNARVHFDWEPVRVPLSNSNAVRIHRYVPRWRLRLEFYAAALDFRYGTTRMITCSSRGRSAGTILRLV
jgi:hypothetical protein